MLILVRHGRTAANAAALLQGRADHPLDELGVEQAAAVGRELRGAARVIASPLARARQTAAAITALRTSPTGGPVSDAGSEAVGGSVGDLIGSVGDAGLIGGAAVEIDSRWYELDYGGFEGRPLADVPAEVWASWRADPDFVPAGGESHTALYQRVSVACDELLAAAAHDDIVVVSHVGPIKAALAWVFGLDPSSGWRCHLDHASITRIGRGPHGPVLRSFNETQHLRPY